MSSPWPSQAGGGSDPWASPAQPAQQQSNSQQMQLQQQQQMLQRKRQLFLQQQQQQHQQAMAAAPAPSVDPWGQPVGTVSAPPSVPASPRRHSVQSIPQQPLLQAPNPSHRISSQEQLNVRVDANAAPQAQGQSQAWATFGQETQSLQPPQRPVSQPSTPHEALETPAWNVAAHRRATAPVVASNETGGSAEVLALRQQLAEAIKKKEESQRREENLETQLKQLRLSAGVGDAARQQLVNTQKENEELKNRVQTLTSENAHMRSAGEQLQQQFSQATRQLSEGRQVLDNLRQELAQSKSEVEKVKAERDALMREKCELLEQVVNLQRLSTDGGGSRSTSRPSSRPPSPQPPNMQQSDPVNVQSASTQPTVASTAAHGAEQMAAGFRQVYQSLQRACEFVANPQNGQQQLVVAGRHIAQQTSLLCNKCKECVNRDSNIERRHRWIQFVRDIAPCNANVLQALRTLAGSLTDSNRQVAVAACRDLLTKIQQVVQFVEKIASETAAAAAALVPPQPQEVPGERTAQPASTQPAESSQPDSQPNADQAALLPPPPRTQDPPSQLTMTPTPQPTPLSPGPAPTETPPPPPGEDVLSPLTPPEAPVIETHPPAEVSIPQLSQDPSETLTTTTAPVAPPPPPIEPPSIPTGPPPMATGGGPPPMATGGGPPPMATGGGPPPMATGGGPPPPPPPPPPPADLIPSTSSSSSGANSLQAMLAQKQQTLKVVSKEEAKPQPAATGGAPNFMDALAARIAKRKEASEAVENSAAPSAQPTSTASDSTPETTDVSAELATLNSSSATTEDTTTTQTEQVTSPATTPLESRGGEVKIAQRTARKPGRKAPAVPSGKKTQKRSSEYESVAFAGASDPVTADQNTTSESGNATSPAADYSTQSGYYDQQSSSNQQYYDQQGYDNTQGYYSQASGDYQQDSSCLFQCRAIYPYTGMNNDELTFYEGDIISVITEESGQEGWYRGRLNDHEGLVPYNYVERLS